MAWVGRAAGLFLPSADRNSIVIQYEDFKDPFPALKRYKNTYTCFNDDIQGTGAVVLAGFINAVKSTGIPPKDQRAVFLGAGSAGVGVARQLVEYFIKEGLSEEQAKKCFWLVDSKVRPTDIRTSFSSLDANRLGPHHE